MKKCVTLTQGFMALMCILMLAGCGEDGKDQNDLRASGSGDSGQGNIKSDEDSENGEAGEMNDKGSEADQWDDSVVWQFRIVDGAESGFLLLAGEGAGEVYTLSPGSDICVRLDGQQAESTVLEDGMMIDVVFDGSVMETFPAQLSQVYEIRAYSRGTEQNPGGTYYDLCGLYLQVLEDLWNADSGLNNNIDYISLDLSQAPGGLTEGEKSAVAWLFGCGHNVTVLTMTYAELAEEDYLTVVSGSGEHALYQWERGVLFTITSGEWEEGERYSLPVLKFNAEKWRSPRGAYFFIDCSATWPEMGTWEGYQIGGEAIS